MTTITQHLYEWYNIHQRDLPWRQTNDPYAIWLSEVILQQTRVDQGLAYYERFMNIWPDIQKLAAANEQEVLKAWQGLGYYSRARNLLATAREIFTKHQGRFPSEYNQIKALKGVGPYTAAAVGSIAFNLPYAVVDGNVMRVLSRLFGILEAVDSNEGRKKIHALAEALLNRENPGMHNQALMEFGALQCLPTNPDCSRCMLQQFCVAYREKIIDVLPRKSKKILTKTRWFNYLICTSPSGVLMQKRTANDIWKGLYEFPLIETDKAAEESEVLSHPHFLEIASGNSFTINKVSTVFKHKLTHQSIMARFFHLHFVETLISSHKKALSLINENQLPELPLPRLIDRYLQENGLDGKKKIKRNQ